MMKKEEENGDKRRGAGEREERTDAVVKQRDKKGGNTENKRGEKDGWKKKEGRRGVSMRRAIKEHRGTDKYKPQTERAKRKRER